ncbi:MAG: energy-coupling factor ABC transporter ATP-binding protein [Defluviitaleaceae bacterium]|nr:energy-coupling factor ABC transporter ATP-binding protein [Defluviitaleaceae bacterium]
MITPIKVSNLSISYGSRPIIQSFALEVQEGEAVLIKGLSGCGKSTLLHAICGILNANISGDIELYGKSIGDIDTITRAGKIGIVFQNPETQLFCDTVEDEIAFGLENLCFCAEEMDKRIAEVLELVDMAAFRHHSPKELSGGQKQRVVLAAVLAMQPKILLLDEALSQMDKASRKVMMAHLGKLRQMGHTMLMVDHDEDLAEIASRIIEI